MLRGCFFAFLVLLTSSTKALASLPLLDRLAKNGFTCQDVSHGYFCQIPNLNFNGVYYPLPIAVLIPESLEIPENPILFLHGYRGMCEPASATAQDMAQRFQLLEQLDQSSASQSVIVFPVSLGQRETYEKYLIPQFRLFLDWALDLIRPMHSLWTLAGHSGAGGTIAMALGKSGVGPIRSVLLMDGTYSMQEKYLPFWKTAAVFSPNMMIRGVYSDSDAKNGAELLANTLGKRKVQIGPSKTTLHCDVPKTDFKDLLNSDNVLVK